MASPLDKRNNCFLFWLGKDMSGCRIWSQCCSPSLSLTQRVMTLPSHERWNSRIQVKKLSLEENKRRSSKEIHFPLFFVHLCPHKIRTLCFNLWSSVSCDWVTVVTGVFYYLCPTTLKTFPFSGSPSSLWIKSLTEACTPTQNATKVLDHWKENYRCWLCSLPRSWL